MATSQRKECTFQWEIRNLWYCSFKKGESVESPMFDLDQSTPTGWSLILYPRGIATEDHVGLYLQRYDVFDEKIMEVNFQFAILDTSGSSLKVGIESTGRFDIGSVLGIEKFATQDEVFGTEKEEFFPRDVLIVQCTIWINDKIQFMAKPNTNVTTTFQTNFRSFFWHIDGFSTLRPHQTNYFMIINESDELLVKFFLVSGLKGEINLEIISCNKSIEFSSFKISVIDSEGKKVNFGSHKFFGYDIQGTKKLLISSEQLMENESRYLPNDVLSLDCEYAFSTGTILHTSVENNFGIISPVVMNEPIENEKIPIFSQNQPHQTQALLDDLKSMYSDAVLCDIELRTSTQTFPTHKNILSARSLVFRRMFTNDMREKNSGHVDITDLEDETLHRMLLYIYTDVLEDLQFESASKLYSAADKYAIISLKEKCSCFLKDNVNPTKACDLLILADRHQDDDLKRAVQDYILSHDREVFGSLEWKDFMATNIQLAADIMYLKVCPR